jgi:nitrite reductase/ring-hydroxylating ferredoxin subunit
MKKVDLSCASRRQFLQGLGCFAGALVVSGIPQEALAARAVLAEGLQTGADRAYPIPSSDGVTVDKTAQVIIVRAAGHVFAFALSCPHQNAAVKWVAKNNQFECTKHDSHYQADGLHTTGRATRNMDRHPIRREGDMLHVDTAHVFQSDKDASGWAAAMVAL